MASGTRRKRDAAAIGAVSLLLGGGAAGAALAGDTERVDDFWAAASVTDGSAEIVEVIDYDFGPRSRRGIFRDVPGLRLGAPVEVDSPTAPDAFTIAPHINGTRIRIGDPDRTISNRHRYTVSYPLDTLVEGDLVSWNAVGVFWEVGIEAAELHLIVDRELTAIGCAKGGTGSSGGCSARQVQPGHVVVETGQISSGDGVTISATMGAPVALAGAEPPRGEPDDPGTGWLPPAVAGGVGAAVAGAAIERPLRRRGREQVWTGGSADVAFGPGPAVTPDVRTVDHADLEDMAATEFAPPRDITAAVGGVIHDEKVTVDHKTAWVVEAAIRGEIELTGDDDDLTLRLGENRPPPSVSNILSTMFAGRTEIPLAEYDEDFAKGWTELGTQLEQWQERSDLWDPSGPKTQRRWRGRAVLAVLAGLAALVVGGIFANRGGNVWLAAVAAGGLLAGGGVAVLIRSHELLVRSPRGSGLWIQIESFRRFIADSEARHAQMAAEMGVLREYTAWAVSLGELDHWTDTVDAAGLERTNPAIGRDLAVIAATPRLCTAVKSASTAPSSSSSGGFSGSVGGGGGGGGGGSW